jgi:hypothetical protein
MLDGGWHPNIYVFASLSAVVSGLAIAGFVYFRAKRRVEAKPFSFLISLGSLWCLFPTFSSLPFSEQTLLLLARLTYVPAAFVPAAFLHFIFAMTDDAPQRL